MTALLSVLIVAGTMTLVGLVIRADEQANERWQIIADESTPEGLALCEAIAAHINAGHSVTDIIGGRLVQHPSGVVKVQLYTTTDAAGMADEAEAFLAGREPRR